MKTLAALNRILHFVSDVTDIEVDEIKSKRKPTHLVDARQLFWFLVRRYTKTSYSQMASFIGGRDHATAIHGVKVVEGRMDVDKEFNKYITEICHSFELNVLHLIKEDTTDKIQTVSNAFRKMRVHRARCQQKVRETSYNALKVINDLEKYIEEVDPTEGYVRENMKKRIKQAKMSLIMEKVNF
jgi:hypothetical protein